METFSYEKSLEEFGLYNLAKQRLRVDMVTLYKYIDGVNSKGNCVFGHWKDHISLTVWNVSGNVMPQGFC